MNTVKNVIFWLLVCLVLVHSNQLMDLNKRLETIENSKVEFYNPPITEDWKVSAENNLQKLEQIKKDVEEIRVYIEENYK